MNIRPIKSVKIVKVFTIKRKIKPEISISTRSTTRHIQASAAGVAADGDVSVVLPAT